MAPTNVKRIRPKIFVPGEPDVFCKIIITADDTTNYTVLDSYTGDLNSNYVIDGSLTRNVTDQLDSFELTLINDNGRFLNIFDGGEVVRIYADNSNATTLIFRGRIDNVSYGVDNSKGFFVSIDGRSYPELVDKTITGIEVAVTADISISGILYEFYSDITLLFWNGTSWSEASYNVGTDTVTWTPAATGFPTTLINTSYQNKKGLTTIADICKRAGLDCYLEYDETNSRWTLRTFVKESITNDNCFVAYGVNMLSMGDWEKDNTQIFNRVTVYGKQESDNIVLMRTKNDTTSQSNLWIKDKILNESDLTTMDEVLDKATSELATDIAVSASGRFSAYGLETLRPGDVIECNVPYTGVSGSYKVTSFTHTLGDSFKTEVEVSERAKTLKDLFVEKINPDDITGVSNLNNMYDSYTIYFDEDPSIMNHTGNQTEESDSKLRLSSGQTTGEAYSNCITTDYDVTACELRRYDNYETIGDQYYVTANGGVNWEVYATSGDIHTFTYTGRSLGVKLILNRASSTATSPAYESVSLLFRG